MGSAARFFRKDNVLSPKARGCPPSDMDCDTAVVLRSPGWASKGADRRERDRREQAGSIFSMAASEWPAH